MKNIKPAEVFGRLVVIADDGQRTKHGKRLLLCKCECGNDTRVTAALLRNGKTKSCGCLQDEMRRGGLHVSHRDSDSPEYISWMAMRRRCYNPNSNRFQHYGGRGITVCERWRDSYENFLADMGRRPNQDDSIDRIDVNGNYEPSNCRWASPIEQANNKRRASIMSRSHHG